MVLAADVLVYIGDLTPSFAQIARVLASGGLFAFTAQMHDGEGYLVGADTRYAHSKKYIEETARQVGFSMRLLNLNSRARTNAR
jgi:predicted TPR repeat methyltransferase